MIEAMTTATRTGWRPRWVVAFLAAVLAVAAGLFTAGPASALTASVAQNAVGASTSAVAVLVGPSAGVAAGQGLGNSPVRPQIVVATGVAANTGSRFGSLTHSSSGIAPYRVQRTVTAGQGGSIEAHYLIEGRFSDVIGQTVEDMPSIVLTQAEHRVFTNAWRNAIPYGPSGTGAATPAQVEGAAQQIYREYPEILQALGLG